MLGFLAGFQTQIMAGMLIIILTGAAGAYWYFDFTQDEIAVLNQNIATLEANTLALKNSIAQQVTNYLLMEIKT